jgi:hypothetical protein
MDISKQELSAIRELRTLRDNVIGLTFDQAPEAFKDIESAKVRLNVLRNPDFYKKVTAKRAAA